ncbi:MULTISPECIES: DoxX family protein [Brucella/Ochrobactrum group]|uniref:DoxX family protein n=1 Tax=Brucella anthropi (strain ATCC 49188 / DSM 6882 / CCUG 24695 / JCM 21032 / LMG 3331 / NBRC 15819 / NCTC 12168 / Alc 37) TaxID=439375 RepID=A6X5P3_BRUA4|nr:MULTISPECIES: DoxX family protein [Brucella/Ochrobactrum group]ABS16547.1 DoxX family protein [Brucella anthropi ATCC 49188]AIK42625.1 doxX family protein [Brucella anthropi]KAB2741676.1 DoxX family protein [Brucella anthropi]KAB2754220.1 DoxX family protein [Brucella anthropi]KAB2764882.1 DoxX family protein [Brucella anthropi]
MSANGWTAAYQPIMLSILRIVAALVLFSYGTEKILGFPSGRSPAMFSLSWTAGVLELVLGFTLLIGLFSRFSAFILSGLMACAYFIGHASQSFFPGQNGGVAAILFCFIFLYLFIAGPGPLSIDASRANNTLPASR